MLLAPVLAVAADLDFELYDLDGRLHRSSRLRSEEGVGLLAIDFFATHCEPCRRAMPEWARLHERWHGKGLRVVIVALPWDDDLDVALAATRRHFRENPVPFPVLWDRYGVVARVFGVADANGARVPQAFLLDRAGRVLLRSDGVVEVALEVERRLGGQRSSPPSAGREASQSR